MRFCKSGDFYWQRDTCIHLFTHSWPPHLSWFWYTNLSVSVTLSGALGTFHPSSWGSFPLAPAPNSVLISLVHYVFFFSKPSLLPPVSWIPVIPLNPYPWIPVIPQTFTVWSCHVIAVCSALPWANPSISFERPAEVWTSLSHLHCSLVPKNWLGNFPSCCWPVRGGPAKQREQAFHLPIPTLSRIYRKQLRWCFELLCLQSPFFASFHTWSFHVDGARFVKAGWFCADNLTKWRKCCFALSRWM